MISQREQERNYYERINTQGDKKGEDRVPNVHRSKLSLAAQMD